MNPSPFPPMAVAVLATLFVAMTPPAPVSSAAPSPERAFFSIVSSAGSSALRDVTSDPIRTQLAPETPGCAQTGLAGRWALRQRVSTTAELPVSGGAKQQARPRLDNPVVAPQTLRPAMHMCVVDSFNPADASGAGRTLHHL